METLILAHGFAREENDKEAVTLIEIALLHVGKRLAQHTGPIEAS
ncbi:hypothetical protein [Methylobacterium nodulans]|nr:hypothetical protein [Methylobacterium nodulans]